MDSSGNLVRLGERELGEIGVEECVEGVVRNRSVSFHRVVAERDGDTVTVTPGKVEISMEEGSTEEVLPLLKEVAEIDKNAHHELCFQENYENIEDYERDGYILASYAKVEDDLYRVVFQVPFYSDNALERFASSVSGEFEKSVFWEGSDPRVAQLLQALAEDGWEPTEVLLDAEEKVSPGERKGKRALDLFKRLTTEDQN